MDVGAVVTAYGSSWNEPDEAARRQLLESAWADDGTYCDPTANVEGREALVAHIGALQVAMPGHTIDLVTGVDDHDDHLRFGLVMYGPDGSAVLEGMDYGHLAEDGRLQQIVGFFGPLPGTIMIRNSQQSRSSDLASQVARLQPRWRTLGPGPRPRADGAVRRPRAGRVHAPLVGR